MTNVDELIDLMKNRDIRGLTRAISIVENDGEGKVRLLNEAFKEASGTCLTLGFTGAPGVGKSTLINSVIKQYRQAGKTVGVITVDPTSPFSGGAVLWGSASHEGAQHGLRRLYPQPCQPQGLGWSFGSYEIRFVPFQGLWLRCHHCRDARRRTG